MTKYKDVNIDELFPDFGCGPVTDFYVYSRTNNPEGATEGTYARYVGTAEHYTDAKGLEHIVTATADVIGGDVYPVGLCIKEENDDE